MEISFNSQLKKNVEEYKYYELEEKDTINANAGMKKPTYELEMNDVPNVNAGMDKSKIRRIQTRDPPDDVMTLRFGD